MEHSTNSGSHSGGNQPPPGPLEEVNPDLHSLRPSRHMVRSFGAPPSTRHTQAERTVFVDIEQQTRDTVIQEREAKTHHWIGVQTSELAPVSNQTTLNASGTPQRTETGALVPFFGPRKNIFTGIQPPKPRL